MRRDDPEVVAVPPTEPLPAEPRVIIALLAPLLTKERLARVVDVASKRTGSVTLVVDGLTDPHNTSAILRSADAFGLPDLHVITGSRDFSAAHRVAKGTHRWIEVRRHASAKACAAWLHAQQYQILVATAGGELRPRDLRQIPKVAFVLGNEHAGASEEMRSLADHSFEIPMVGFVESLNVSVAAAITLHAATEDRHGDLPAEQRERLIARYLMTSVRDAERLVRERTGV